MSTGDCERAFARAALEDGIRLERARVPWLNQRGHLGLPVELRAQRELLSDIFAALGGRLEEQAAKRVTPLPGDFVHEESGLLIEVDESQHFTSFRLRTLDIYPPDLALGFNVDDYRRLCEEWRTKSDRYRRDKSAVGFGPGGRQRQRAYHDALRDVVAPAMGRPPVIRVAVCDGDGSAAYARARDRIAVALA